MKKFYLLTLLLVQLGLVIKTNAQNIAINATGSLPDTSAMLDISSTTKGLLAPRMTTAQQNAIPLPANGLLIFNTTDNVFKVNMGTPGVPLWTPLATGSGAAITSLNGLTPATQTFATGTSGTDFGISSSGTVHTFNIPTASAVNRGALSPTDWASFNAKLGLTSLSATAPLSYDNTTGVFSISQANTSTPGYLSNTDWNTFNGKAPLASPTFTGTPAASTAAPGTNTTQLATTAFVNAATTGKIGLTSLSASAPLTYNNTTGAFTISQANTSTNGYLSSTDWNTFNSKGAGTVTNVAALTIGTSGTNVSSSVATGTTTPVITLNIPTASATNRGALSAADWTSFNSKIGLTSLSASAPLSYNNTTGAFTINQANTSTNGYLSSADWNTFNSKQGSISLTTTGNNGSSTLTGNTLNVPTYTLAGLGGIGLTALSATGPLTYNSGTGAFAINQATTSTNGYLSSADWNTFNSKGAGSVTNVAAITLGTTGTDLSTSVATSSTTPVLTLNVPTASAANRGALSAADWTTFNSKAPLASPAFTGTPAAPTAAPGTSTTQLATTAFVNAATTGKIGLTSLSASAPLSYNNTTGAFTISQANTSTNGYLSSTDWNTFNGKIGLTALSASAPLSYNNATGAFTITQANAGSNGYLSAADWNTFNNKQGSISLTTTGNNGAATLSGSTLNIPTYTLAGLGGISLTALSASGPLTYNSGTGAFSISQANTTTNGYLSSTDWNTFNGKIGLTALSASGPLAYNNGTGAFTITQAGAGSNGYLSAADWNTFNSKGAGSVTNVAAITLGTTGTDLSASVATSSTTPVLTLNVPTASAANRGALSAADWTTFNSKAPLASPTFTGTPAAPTAAPGTSTTQVATTAFVNAATTGKIGLTSLSASAPLSYNNTTGAFTISQANTTTSGYLSNTDWNTFNNKQGALTLTTTGTSGAATLVGNTLNIPAYAAASSAWSLNGNTGITQPAVPGTYGTSTLGASENFLGTKDAKDLVFATNNIEKMRFVNSTGYLGIGTAAPTKPIDLVQSVANGGLMKIQNTATNGYSSIDIWSNTTQIGNVGFSNSGASYPNLFYFATNTTNGMVFATNNAQRMIIDGTNGNIGIGPAFTAASPATASLQLEAGTSAAGTAPLKFTSGTSLSTPENGAVEFDGTHFYGTAGATRYQLDNTSAAGTVTSASVVNANGFTGSVANATTTPAITLGTNVTGMLKGNGAAISAATAGTDYLTPTGSAAGLTSFPTLNQNTTGTAANVTGTVAVVNGGTGMTSVSTGDMLYGSAANTLSRLPAGTNGQMLMLNAGIPAWVNATAPTYAPTIYVNASRTSTYTVAAAYSTLVYNSTTTNIAGSYNTTSGVFTAPVSGLYQIIYSNMYSTSSATNNYIFNRVIVNGSTDTENALAITPYSGTTISSLNGSTMAQLSAGQTVSISVGGEVGTIAAQFGAGQTTLKIIRLY